MEVEIPEGEKARYVFLGKSGLKVSNIGLGTMTFGQSLFGHPGQTDEAKSHEILDRFAAWGGNFIDTADLYGFGEAEQIIGSWLQRQTRENYVIASKCRFNATHAPLSMGRKQMINVNSEGLSRRHITESIDRSLERLRTNYIDLYQTHCFDDATPLEETYRTLDDLVRCGKVRYVGASNVTGWQLQKIVQTQKELGLNPIISLQQQYSLACRESEMEPFQVCKSEGISVLPWSALKGGLLTGKVQRGQKPTEGRLAWAAEDERSRDTEVCPTRPNIPERMYDVIEAATAIGKKHGRTTAQVSLRWLLQKDVVSSVIIGARTLEQVDQNMVVNGWSLSLEEMQQLDDLSAHALPYPYEMVFRMNKDRKNPKASNFYVESCM